MLKDIIESENLNEDISIIISDNCSPDNTRDIVVQEIESYKNIQIIVFKQDSNIGFTKNIIFAINKASAEYCMLLGDDDYINADYLTRVIHEIKNDKNITCIFPSYQNIYPDKTHVNGLGRDLNKKTRYYPKGFLSCCANIRKTGQMSGLIFRKKGMTELFTEKGMNNLYPQIFFMMINCLNGKSLHLVNFPVLVTHIPQSQKDWKYGSDGLMPDQFENCINLDLSLIKLSILEILLFVDAKYLLRNYKYKDLKNIVNHRNTTSITKFFILLYVPYIKMEKVLKIIYWTFKSNNNSK